jgi:uncharacterized protein
LSQREIDTLTQAECMELLAQQVIGRIVFVDEQGPGAVPVNFAVVGDEIVLRVAEDSHLRKLINNPIGFEADHTNADQTNGWSVLVRGSGREVPLAQVAGLLRSLGDALPRPWAEGVHNTWLAIKVESVTGRRLSGEINARLF